MPSARRAVAQASAGGAQNISEKQFLSHPTFSVRFASIRQALTKSKIFELRERRTHVIYRNESDETLVMLTLAGEQSAYETLVVRHQRAVMASARFRNAQSAYGGGCVTGRLCHRMDEIGHPAGRQEIQRLGVPYCEKLRLEYGKALSQLSAF